jgi:hypothetical protein
MDQITEFVSEQNKEWVASLTPKNIAELLDTLSMVPFMKQKKYEDRSEVAANLGKQGESDFEDIVDKFLPSDYKLQNVAKTGKCGDFILTWCSHKTNQIYKLLIELKNYKTTVPSKEVEKFYRDLQLNQVDGGLLISLNSKIIGVSKMIEFKEALIENKKMPILFVNSKTPELIAEVIKLAFHTIEVKCQYINEVINYDSLVLHINSLCDSIQTITRCRDNLQIAKQTIETNINDIMFQLMGCEYELVNKIKNIQTTLKKEIPVVEAKDPETLFEQVDIVNDIMMNFGHSLDIEYKEFLYIIYRVGWCSTKIDIPKKMWELCKENSAKKALVKFTKKNATAIFPYITDVMLNIISDMTTAKPKSDGTYISINKQNINHILELCQLL